MTPRADQLINDKPPAPGPRELKILLELTMTYSIALQDTIAVFEETMREHPHLALLYARLIDYLRSLVSPGEGGLQALERECRVLLGLEEETERE